MQFNPLNDTENDIDKFNSKIVVSVILKVDFATQFQIKNFVLVEFGSRTIPHLSWRCDMKTCKKQFKFNWCGQ